MHGTWATAMIVLASTILLLTCALLLRLMLRGEKLIREFIRGLRRGINGFDDASKEVGKNLGGIYGEPVAEALTTENQTVEVKYPVFGETAIPESEGAKVAKRSLWEEDPVYQNSNYRLLVGAIVICLIGGLVAALYSGDWEPYLAFLRMLAICLAVLGLYAGVVWTLGNLGRQVWRRIKKVSRENKGA